MKTRTNNLSLLSVLLIIISILTLCFFSEAQDQAPAELLHSFKYIDYWFENEVDHQDYLQRELYKHVTLAGIKIYEPRSWDGSMIKTPPTIFVSVPRWKEGVPATFGKLVTKENEQTKQMETRIEPFPSWDMNTISADKSNEEVLKSVLGFEIDSKNRLWILDQGKVGGNNAEAGDIKLVVWDLDKNELIDTIVFPEHIASLNSSFLNDLVVDDSSNIAFISDSGIPTQTGDAFESGIIVVDLDDPTSLKKEFLQFQQTLPDPDLWIKIDFDKPCLSTGPMKTGVDGIALSCDKKHLYWTPLTSRKLYAIESQILVQYSSVRNGGDLVEERILNESLVEIGYKKSASDGLICSSSGKMFLSGIETNTIYQVDETELAPYVERKKTFIPQRSTPDQAGDFFEDKMTELFVGGKGNRSTIWPDTLSISSGGQLYFVTNNLCDFIEEKLNFETDKNNFNIWKVDLPEKQESYVFGCDQSDKKYGILEYITIGFCVVSFIVGLIFFVILGRLEILIWSALKTGDWRKYFSFKRKTVEEELSFEALNYAKEGSYEVVD